jgi:outer membrane scaffolding protein for murein synthesis (MipA/OmpV family)
MFAATGAAAREEPLWEAGVGIAGVHFPHYRGSDRNTNYVLPAPYFVYRGDYITSDRKGLRGLFMRTDYFDLDLSVGASLPVKANDDPARAGMADLKPSLELGPSLKVHLWRADDRRVQLDARFPVRGAMTVESHPRFIGGQFFPHLNVDIYDPAGLRGWNLGLVAGAVYADGRNNRYFYEVTPAEATAHRLAYSPGGGFAGTQFLVAVSKRFPNFWVGGFARYDSLRGAVFESSPLVVSKRYFAAGFGVSWIFARSSTTVTTDEFGEERRR